MRAAFAHDAVLEMESSADRHAPGAAITVALCGHWQHEPPCPLAPHHTEVDDDGAEVRLRILFAAEPPLEPEVRRRIHQALAAGRLDGPDGVTQWTLRSSEPGAVSDDEANHAGRLIQS